MEFPNYPGGVGDDSLSDIAADPGVDKEWQGGNIAEEQTGAEGSDVCDDDLDKQNDTCIADLV